MTRLIASALVVAWAIGGALCANAQVLARTTSEPARPPAEVVLARSFADFYAQGYASVRLTNYHGNTKGIERGIKVWAKGGHVLGIFATPPSLSGTGFLVIPPTAKERAAADSVPDNQDFIYLPAFGQVRRVSGAQHADPFFGTCLSQGDMERHPASDFRIVSMRDREFEGEAVYELTVTPRFEAGFDRVVGEVAKKDYAPLRLAEYRSGHKTPIRVIEVRRAWWTKAQSGQIVPEKVLCSKGKGGLSTVVVFSSRDLHAHMPNSMFTTDYLQRTGH